MGSSLMNVPFKVFFIKIYLYIQLEPQNNLGWKESLEVIWFISLLKAGSARTGSSGQHPVKLEYVQGWRFHNSLSSCPNL